ncbi:similar to Saccharomyces cerevisiae YDL028C MPS1 Dual-specificity kinase required for spindle pole body (SPB) duplication and spindle checkpoint function [Maudiozyma barnettii]|uniref:Similar to Saccharomyces cerevisiae YDL028C MPS1 Dual-specificity kinase required for spindle pole body (SPB) duplication and spindle checkpoint function n=1 Tax=Maudiozyma barnettii TaxID=61262 RepID=A0A8H2VDE3_9SACH|nr:serine/threonine/tyrosine protein kinase MPS1 [Kazachstania barnettii]CAB4253193.1 similar to Saccharomyces cerevisiae YDL028C MPS1 Dual-specificity kinase required for spindle pole body (SPB) duplication and spindle checkpoint function [Kazachstania barnettii]CAD1780271.1 similar to Saccharomyces cerevisiae YDL028C MPS1 Dual-specificity kinase required for spindle pole body (SPB) duplication and spindle checkpoint function [Kazachstania barnettii]
MSKYKHHSRSRIQEDGDGTPQTINTIHNNSDYGEDEDNIGPPKLSNFGSALLARGNDTGQSNFLTGLQMAETLTNPVDPHSISHTIYSQTQDSPQSSLFAMNHNNNVNLTSRPLSMTTVHDGNNNNKEEDISKQTGNFSPSEKLRSMQQHMKDELTSRYTERRINRLLLSSNRMSKLGPAKRTSSLQSVDMNDQFANNTGNNHSNVGNLTTKSLSGTISTSKPVLSPSNTEAVLPSEPLNDYSNINFGDLNPLQYLKKHDLPSSELPHISKIYFEKRKEEIRRTALRKYSSSKDILLNRTRYIEENKNNNSNNDIRSNKTDRRNVAIDKRNSILVDRPEEPVNKIITPREHENVGTELKVPVDTFSIKNKKREALSNISLNKKEPEYKKTKKVEIQEPIKTHTYKRNNIVRVNDIEYERIEMLGRGGSSKVYKVKGPGNKVYALKRVIFDEFDETSVNGFKGEIELLQKLDMKDRVVHLYDYMMNQGLLYLIMECGDFDLSQILNTRINDPFDASFIRYYTKEMIECIKVVHDSGIVHSDLKPANFVVVKGKLKIIDFGIANAVPDHTVNIYRDTQIGTPNYMAPEALITMNYSDIKETSENDPNEKLPKNTWKVGKPSDIWSCGCILYQMVYGKPPYAGFQGQNRLLAIMNPDVKISFNEKTDHGKSIVPKSLLELMKQCLIRDPDKRCTVNEILGCPFLNPVVVTEFFIKDLIKNAVTFGAKQRYVSDDKIEELTNDVLSRLEEFKM